MDSNILRKIVFSVLEDGNYGREAERFAYHLMGELLKTPEDKPSPSESREKRPYKTRVFSEKPCLLCQMPFTPTNPINKVCTRNECQLRLLSMKKQGLGLKKDIIRGQNVVVPMMEQPVVQPEVHTSDSENTPTL